MEKHLHLSASLLETLQCYTSHSCRLSYLLYPDLASSPFRQQPHFDTNLSALLLLVFAFLASHRWNNTRTHIHTHTPPHTHPHIGYTHTHKPTPCVCSTRSSCLLLSSVNTLSPGPLKCPPHSPSFPFSLTHSHYLSFLTSQQDPALRELLGGGRLAVSSVYWWGVEARRVCVCMCVPLLHQCLQIGCSVSLGRAWP